MKEGASELANELCSACVCVLLAVLIEFTGILVLEVHVELLIRAHDCFTLSCNMEGISDVLRAARLWNVKLIKSKSYSLMVCNGYCGVDGLPCYGFSES